MNMGHALNLVMSECSCNINLARLIWISRTNHFFFFYQIIINEWKYGHNLNLNV